MRLARSKTLSARVAGLFMALCGLLAGQAQAGTVQAFATASVTVLDRGGLAAPTAFVFSPPAARGASDNALASLPSGNAQLTISGQVGDMLSIAAPSTFTLVRDGGDGILTANMHATLAEDFGGQDLMTAGSVLRAGSTKVDFGCQLTQASAAAPPPGAYQGQFTVLIQYN